MPTRVQSLGALAKYTSRMRAAMEAGQHHDQRREILIELLRDGFGLTVDEIELEHNVKVAKVRGRIDLLYGALAWEVKRDLDIERDDLERELRLYLTAKGPNSFGIGTDGLNFEVYRLDGNGDLKQADKFALEAAGDDVGELLDWLDGYLFAIDRVMPTGEAMVGRFGINSAVYRAAEETLLALWKRVENLSSAQLKRAEWERLLEVVYGTRVGSDGLWVRHTFLVMVARLMAFLATTGKLPARDSELGALTGELFEQLGLENMVERDFFAWAAEPSIEQDARKLLRSLSSHLGQFALQLIDEDVLKELYEHVVDPVERHDLGEFYTPDWLADLVLERAGFDPTTRMLDPACGSGTFLFAAIRQLRDSGLQGAELVERAVNNLVGLDLHPLAVTTSRANFVLALRADLAKAERALVIPVFMADTLAAPEQGFGLMVEIQTPSSKLPPPPGGEPPYPDRFQLPTERDAQQTASLGQVVDFMDDLASPSNDRQAAVTAFKSRLSQWGIVTWEDVWLDNLRLLRALREGNQDTIWSFVLTNAARPHELAQDPVDLVAGNPPWLTVKDMAGGGYKSRVQGLAREYGLLVSGDGIAAQGHVDTSTVFACFCAANFLPDDRGRLAFVLPRSVMAGAKQHEHFREGRAKIGYTPVEAIDLLDVRPLFRIPACAMIFDVTTGS